MLRIVGGKHRGRAIATPEGQATRPPQGIFARAEMSERGHQATRRRQLLDARAGGVGHVHAALAVDRNPRRHPRRVRVIPTEQHLPRARLGRHHSCAERRQYDRDAERKYPATSAR